MVKRANVRFLIIYLNSSKAALITSRNRLHYNVCWIRPVWVGECCRHTVRVTAFSPQTAAVCGGCSSGTGQKRNIWSSRQWSHSLLAQAEAAVTRPAFFKKLAFGLNVKYVWDCVQPSTKVWIKACMKWHSFSPQLSDCGWKRKRRHFSHDRCRKSELSAESWDDVRHYNHSMKL